MSYRNDRKCFELYCCLPHEFRFDYSNEKKHRNANALSRRLMKSKNETPTYQKTRRRTNKIMSIDTFDHHDGMKINKKSTQSRQRTLQMADGDKQQSNSCVSTELLSIDSKTKDLSHIDTQSEAVNLDEKHVRSLSESVNELCLAIRKLLHYETTEQGVTSLQTIVTNQLAILLTYLTVPNNEKIVSELSTKRTSDKMTSTTQTTFLSTVETQTDILFDVAQETSMDKSLSIKNTTSSNNNHEKKRRNEIIESVFSFFSNSSFTWLSTSSCSV